MAKKKCSVCNTVDDHIACDKCSNAFCFQCADVTLSEARILKKTKFKFECTACCNSKDSGSDMTEYAKTMNKLVEAINTLQTQVQTIQRQLSESQSNNQNGQPNMKDMDSVIHEMEERDRRAKNIIIYDIEENDSEDTNVRVNHDTQAVANLLTSLDSGDQNHVKVRRLGKKSNESKPRPLLVTLDSRMVAVSILKNARLKRMKSIKNDLTLMQREKLESLRNKLKSKHENGEMNWTIKYTNGSPQLCQTDNNLNTTAQYPNRK
uniref:Uncharacterized protein n=1 Tax=Cacopsylla melanoneura TaxID=428564 RepID=A0A8D8UZB1_9HEMI